MRDLLRSEDHVDRAVVRDGDVDRHDAGRCLDGLALEPGRANPRVHDLAGGLVVEGQVDRAIARRRDAPEPHVLGAVATRTAVDLATLVHRMDAAEEAVAAAMGFGITPERVARVDGPAAVIAGSSVAATAEGSTDEEKDRRRSHDPEVTNSTDRRPPRARVAPGLLRNQRERVARHPAPSAALERVPGAPGVRAESTP
ncbi:MAG: hypothetical protein M5U28_11530 [Sandaracinaceae bacterium]|nr:hypothetical protein [Sandaracinaceae bacterium]